MEKIRKYLAECIGTFVLVFFACGTACAVGCDAANGSGYLLTALAFGLVIVAMAYSIGNISGCHINPAVSIAMWVKGDLSGKDFIGYVVSQCVGSLLGTIGLLIAFGKDCGFGANGLLNGTTAGGAFLVEVVLTFVFVFAILGVTSKKEFGSVSGIVIGLTLTLVHILGIYFTGTSVNPARSLFPAIFAGGDALKHLWIFLTAPLCGGVLAAVAWKAIAAKKQ